MTALTPDAVLAERAAVSEEARSWLGTPYHLHARLKGVGVDCAQFIIGVYEALGLLKDVQLAPYDAQWFMHRSQELFLLGMETHFHRIGDHQAPVAPGDVVLFRYGRAVSHGGIAVSSTLVVHADRALSFVTAEECGPHSALAQRMDSVWCVRRWKTAHAAA